MGRSSIPKPYYMVEIEVTGGIVVRYIVYKFVKLSNEFFYLKHSW